MKTWQQAAKELLSMKIHSDEFSSMDCTLQEGIIKVQIKKALKGDTKAAAFIKDITCADDIKSNPFGKEDEC